MRSNEEILDHLHAVLLQDCNLSRLAIELTADEVNKARELVRGARLISRDCLQDYERQIADLEQRRIAAVEREAEAVRQRNIAISALHAEHRLVEQVGRHTERVSALIERAGSLVEPPGSPIV